MPESRLLLLDGHSLAYRAFYALPVENFSTTTGQPTNAVFGFTSMLINVLRDERPTHVAVAFDVSRQTFRTESFPEYKANRASSPAEFAGQVDLIREILAALAIPVLSIEGYEADDIIATLVKRSADRGMTVDIVTGDRDAFQLVSDRVTVLYPKKGVSDLARMTPAAVEEKYGLSPAQYPDYAALRGDPSDNLPGIPGVGEKTAAKWIREYGSLAELVDHVDQVGGKVGDSLRAALPQVLVNRHLTQLVDDVPVPLDLDEAVLEPWDRSAVDRLFDTLQFRALRDRLDKVRPASEDDAITEAAAEDRPDAEIIGLVGTAAATWLAGGSRRARGGPRRLVGAWTRRDRRGRRRGRPRGRRLPRLHGRDDRRRPARLACRSRCPQGPARCQGRRAGAGHPWPGPRRRAPGHGPGGLPGGPGPSRLRARRRGPAHPRHQHRGGRRGRPAAVRHRARGGRGPGPGGGRDPAARGRARAPPRRPGGPPPAH